MIYMSLETEVTSVKTAVKPPVILINGVTNTKAAEIIMAAAGTPFLEMVAK